MYRVGLILFHIGMVSYLASLAHSIAYVLRGSERVATRGLGIALGALGLHGVSIVVVSIGQGTVPWANSLQNISFWCWVVVGISAVVSLKLRLRILWLFVLPLVVVLLFIAMTGQKSSSPYGETVGQTFWAALHIGLIFVAYATFAFAAVTGFMYILQSHYLKKKEMGELYGKLPPLVILDRLNYGSLLAGLAFLSVGLLVGFLWLASLPEKPEGSDPKIVAALVTWGAYLAVFLLRATSFLRGKKVAWLSIVGIGVIVLSFLLVPHVIPKKLRGDGPGLVSERTAEVFGPHEVASAGMKHRLLEEPCIRHSTF
ncbi:MAG: cytochrome c biogenesis protein CcsA [bacterium]|nr:cytochrome c biogenesis protein CcsA [bacterium]